MNGPTLKFWTWTAQDLPHGLFVLLFFGIAIVCSAAVLWAVAESL